MVFLLLESRYGEDFNANLWFPSRAQAIQAWSKDELAAPGQVCFRARNTHLRSAAAARSSASSSLVVWYAERSG